MNALDPNKEYIMKIARARIRNRFRYAVKDAKELTRCRDCVFFKKYGEHNVCQFYWSDPHDFLAMKPDDFCSYAERAKDEANH